MTRAETPRPEGTSHPRACDEGLGPIDWIQDPDLSFGDGVGMFFLWV